ncbi:MAG: transposase domain-containing protein [Saprospiraceae bacterium]|nr:transposase domain-containing protein [Saprospiraceae bacterium]
MPYAPGIREENYLFAGGHEAALNIATFYTVLTNCKSQDINPYEYLYWFLKKVPDTNINAIETLTPASYKNQE